MRALRRLYDMTSFCDQQENFVQLQEILEKKICEEINQK
jgi:hypothetical protein